MGSGSKQSGLPSLFLNMNKDKVDSSCPGEGTTSTSIFNEASEEGPKALKEELQSYIDSQIESAIHEARQNWAPKPPLWTIDQVADYLQISVRTVEKEISAGRISTVMARGQRRFEEKHIDKYVRRNTG